MSVRRAASRPDIDRLTAAPQSPILETISAPRLRRLDLPYRRRSDGGMERRSALGRTYAIHGERAPRRRTANWRPACATGCCPAGTFRRRISKRRWRSGRPVQAQVSDLDAAGSTPSSCRPTPIPAVDAERRPGRILNGAPVDGTPQCSGRLARLASFTGQPAISVPGRPDGASGLPAGLQLIGDWNRDEALLEIAACYRSGERLVRPAARRWTTRQ